MNCAHVRRLTLSSERSSQRLLSSFVSLQHPITLYLVKNPIWILLRIERIFSGLVELVRRSSISLLMARNDMIEFFDAELSLELPSLDFVQVTEKKWLLRQIDNFRWKPVRKVYVESWNRIHKASIFEFF